jgi:hypothetical protein
MDEHQIVNKFMHMPPLLRAVAALLIACTAWKYTGGRKHSLTELFTPNRLLHRARQIKYRRWNASLNQRCPAAT